MIVAAITGAVLNAIAFVELFKSSKSGDRLAKSASIAAWGNTLIIISVLLNNSG